MKKKLAYSDLRAFRECPQQYWKRVNRAKRVARTVHEAVGDITHAASADDSKERQAHTAKQLAELPQEQRAEVAKVVEELTAAALEMSEAQDVSDREKEKQLRWLDPETGWELLAKPDEIGMVEDPRGGEILQIVDNKTAYKLRSKHLKQLYFFGLVARLAKKYPGAIRLVVRLLRSKDEAVFFSSPKKVDRELAKIRRTIRAIESRLASGNFEAVTGKQCEGCPYREGCDAYQQMLKVQSSRNTHRQHALPVVQPERK